MVFVPVLQPAQQLAGTALVSLLTNHRLQRAWPVFVHPQQSGILSSLFWGRLRSCGGGGGGGQSQFPTSGVTWASTGWSATIFCPDSMTLSQASLWRARGLRGRGVTLRRRDLLGWGGSLWGLAGRCLGLWGFVLKERKIIFRICNTANILHVFPSLYTWTAKLPVLPVNQLQNYIKEKVYRSWDEQLSFGLTSPRHSYKAVLCI